MVSVYREDMGSRNGRHTLPRKFEVVHKKTTKSKRIRPNVCRATPPTSELVWLDPFSIESESLIGADEDLESSSSKPSDDSRISEGATVSGSTGGKAEFIMLSWGAGDQS
jgi:hypothetical protein